MTQQWQGQNLYRYRPQQPNKRHEPLGEEVAWTQSLVGEPQFGGRSGFSMQVKQVLSGGRAAPGAQTWQTNNVKFIALISKDGKCWWDDKHSRRLDVHFLTGAPPYSFTDTVSADYDPNGGRHMFPPCVNDEKPRSPARTT